VKNCLRKRKIIFL